MKKVYKFSDQINKFPIQNIDTYGMNISFVVKFLSRQYMYFVSILALVIKSF